MKQNKKIYAVVGMAGSGKSEAIKYLQTKFGWPKVYLGEATFRRLEKEGLELNYENERLIREKIRAELGMGAYALLALDKIKKLLAKHQIVLIESMYSWAEYKIFKKEFGQNFYVIAVYASSQTRFQRLRHRPQRPINNWQEFVKRDWTEIEGTDKGGPIAIADYTLINESSLADLYKQIDNIFNN